ncbi:RNA-binding domain-containing protein [Streptomyces bottropensis]|uniref:RNA-binding domain-containing protein n=1 Tax=Streptomyces bottropensis TaxID=42235 RepID=UPI0036C005D5
MAAEGRDLDHKLAPHDTGTEGGGEPAQAIAAFANSTGGVLVLGLQDDRRTSVPVHASPIQLTDGPRRRYSETLASRRRRTWTSTSTSPRKRTRPTARYRWASPW